MIEQASLVIGEGNWAVKSDSLLGYKINGGKYYPREMSVVRATTGTRINEDGLVELVPYNLAQYSEQFNNAWWVKYQVNVTADNTTAPNGTTTADKVIASANGAAIVYRSETYLVNGVYNFSIYAKAGNQDKIYLEAYGVGGTACSVNFNLTTQTIISPTNFTNVNIENVGNGWFRISATFSNLGGSIVTFGFGMATSVSTNDFAYFWGGQLVEGSSALDYLPTTDRLDVARIDYSSGSGALLVEPQRTNLALYSSSFSNAAWTKVQGSGGSAPIVTANYGVSPDGTQNADRIQLTRTSASFSYSYVYQEFTATIGQPYTWSVWLKSLNGTPSVALTYNGSVYSNIVTLTNEWERYEFTTTAAGTGCQVTFLLYELFPSTSLTADFLAYGFQAELGSYQTSYIPTQAATVTRNADVISKTGIADLIGQTEGTLFLDVVTNGLPVIDQYYMNISDGTTSNIVYLGFYSTILVARIINVGSLEVNINIGLAENTRYKIAFAYKNNDCVVYVNGVLQGSDNSATIPATSKLSYNDFNGAANFDLNSSALYKTRLTNAELATLTTI